MEQIVSYRNEWRDEKRVINSREVKGSVRDSIWGAVKEFDWREWEEGCQVFQTVGQVWSPRFSSCSILTIKLHPSVVDTSRSRDCTSVAVKTGMVSPRSSLFWDAQQRILVVSYRRFGKTYPSHLQGWSSLRRKLVTVVSVQPIRHIFKDGAA